MLILYPVPTEDPQASLRRLHQVGTSMSQVRSLRKRSLRMRMVDEDIFFQGKGISEGIGVFGCLVGRRADCASITLFRWLFT